MPPDWEPIECHAAHSRAAAVIEDEPNGSLRHPRAPSLRAANRQRIAVSTGKNLPARALRREESEAQRRFGRLARLL